MSTWAVMKDGLVSNAIIAGDDMGPILSTLIPEADEFILATVETGPVQIGGDVLRGRFRAPQTYPSWIWDDGTWNWVSPTPYPEDGNTYVWDEDTPSWVDVTTLT